MNNVDYDPWDDIQLSPEESIQAYNEKPDKDPWDEVEFQEGFWKNAFRTALQIPQGYAEATNRGIAAGLWHLLGSGEVLDPEEIERIRDISEREGIPFDEDSYREAAQNAAASIPTVSNIAGAIEGLTGLPLEPKTGLQKGLRLGSSAYKFQGGPTSQRAAAGITAPVASEALQQVGVPEPLAELGGLGIGNVVGAKTPGINLTKTKPSGMPERGFERLKEPTEVPAKKIQQINDKLEKDFKTISDEIIKDSPIGETAENLKNHPRFKRESKELLDQAQILANDTPGTIPSMNYKQNLLKQSQSQIKGFALNEYKKNYLKFMKEAVENVVPENVSYGELVEQYRENNRSLGEYFEPGASKALNRAKKDVLLDQNRAIASTLEESNPELSKVFKEGNERWTKIMDAETVDNFVSDMFPEGKKVDFKHMKGVFDDPNYQRIFKRALGEEGAKSFEQAVEDMLTAERPYKMMREAQEKGFGDMLLTAKAYLFSPKLGYAKAGIDALRFGYRSLFNATLDKPRIGLNFTKAVKELKAGNFKAAERDFKEVQAEVLPKEKPKEVARPEETIEVTPEETAPKQIEAPKKQIEYKNHPESKRSFKEQEYDLHGHKIKEINVDNAEGKKIGSIAYSEFNDPPMLNINFIESEKGSNVFIDLLKKLHEKNPNAMISGSNFTDQGAKIFSKLTGKKIPPHSFDPNHSVVLNPEEIQTILNKYKKTEPKPTEAPKKQIEHKAKEHVEEAKPKEELKEPKIPKKKGKSEEKQASKSLTEENSFSEYDYHTLIDAYEAGKFKEQANALRKELAEKKLHKQAEKQKSLRETENKIIEKNLKEADRLENEAAKNEKEGRSQLAKKKSKRAKEIREAQEQVKKAIEKEDKKSPSKKLSKEEENHLFGKKSEKPTASLTENKVKEVKRQDISKQGLKTQKTYLLEQIKNAIDNPPKGDKVTFDVPGDGVFKINNNETALKKFAENIEKRWPDKPYRRRKP